MIAARRLYITAGILVVAAAACLLVALLRRHHIEDSLTGIEGAYFDRGGNGLAYGRDFSADVLDPFQIGNAYFWLGLAAGLTVAAGAVGLVTALRRAS